MTDSASQGANEAVLLRDDRDGVATLTLNRPDKFNALSTELMGAVQDQLDALMDDRSIKVVVIAANGRAFCAGHDLQEMKAMTGREPLSWWRNAISPSPPRACASRPRASIWGCSVPRPWWR